MKTIKKSRHRPAFIFPSSLNFIFSVIASFRKKAKQSTFQYNRRLASARFMRKSSVCKSSLLIYNLSLQIFLIIPSSLNFIFLVIANFRKKAKQSKFWIPSLSLGMIKNASSLRNFVRRRGNPK